MPAEGVREDDRSGVPPVLMLRGFLWRYEEVGRPERVSRLERGRSVPCNVGVLAFGLAVTGAERVVSMLPRDTRRRRVRFRTALCESDERFSSCETPIRISTSCGLNTTRARSF